MVRRFGARLHVLVLLSALFLALPLQAEDWPAWTGPFGQNRSAETGLPQHFDRSDLTNIRWATALGTVAFGSPTISDGRVFVGTNHGAIRDDRRFVKSRGGVLVCLDETTGETLWRLVSPEREDGFPKNAHMVNQRWGICSSPTIDGNRLYVITNGDDLLCIDVHGLANGNDGPFVDESRFMARAGRPPIELNDGDGDIIWRFDIPRELSVAPHDVASCSVLIVDDVAYASTSNGLGSKNPAEALMPDAPAFIALDKLTGELLAVENEGISKRLFHAQWSSPSKGSVGDKTLIFVGGGDGICYAFEAVPDENGPGSARATGFLKTAWTYDCNPDHYKFTAEGDRIWYYQGDTRTHKYRRNSGGALEGLNTGDGSFIGPNEILATPIFHEGRVYIATGRDPSHGLGRGVLHCIDATLTGDVTESGRVWTYEGIGRTLASVTISNGLVYAADLQGRLHCLDAKTGHLYWVHSTDEESWGSPLVADGKIYFNTRRSFWILAEGKEKEVLFTQRGGSESGAVAANGTVYAFMRGRLHALQRGVEARTHVDNENADTDDATGDEYLPAYVNPPEVETPELGRPATSLRVPLLLFAGVLIVIAAIALSRRRASRKGEVD